MRLSQVWSLLLVAAVGILPILPPEHVHEVTDADGHHVLVAHRHVRLHAVDVQRPQRGDTIDHADPVAIDLDGAYTTTARYALHAPVVARGLLIPPSSAPLWIPAARFVDRLIHAPPRAPSSLRAPPALRLL